jgi:hypothetical protein
MLLSELKVEEKTMTIDTYTKFIMTIIAGALLVIALKGTGIIPPAFAHSGGVHKIAICDSEGRYCATVRSQQALHYRLDVN